MKILIIEADQEISTEILIGLELNGHTVVILNDVGLSAFTARDQDMALIISNFDLIKNTWFRFSVNDFQNSCELWIITEQISPDKLILAEKLGAKRLILKSQIVHALKSRELVR